MLALKRFLQAHWVDADFNSGEFFFGGVSKTAVSLTGDRGFESISLQRRVSDKPGREGAII